MSNQFIELDNKLYDRYEIRLGYWKYHTVWNAGYGIYDKLSECFVKPKTLNELDYVLLENQVTPEIIADAKTWDVDSSMFWSEIARVNQPIRQDRTLYLNEVFRFSIFS
jgi:hypothetical protein